jgi:hypothetical protein
MKLYCPRSGISYNCNIGYGHGRVIHPIFGLPIKSLIKGQLEPFIAGNLTPEETHLFGCALLAKLPIQWEAELSFSIWQESWNLLIENLAVVALRMDSRYLSELPGFHIQKDTNSPDCIRNYIRILNNAISELRESSTFIETSIIKDRAEEAILRIIRNTMNKMADPKNNNKLPKLMALWAASVGRFPKTTIPIDAIGTQIPLAEYWKDIIIKVFTDSSHVSLLSDTIQIQDIEELLEHCEQTIEVGTLHSLMLFKKLRSAISVLKEFRPDQISINSGDPVSILLGNAAPKEYQIGEPQLSQFPNISAYIAAKKAWKAKNEN